MSISEAIKACGKSIDSESGPIVSQISETLAILSAYGHIISQVHKACANNDARLASRKEQEAKLLFDKLPSAFRWK